MYGRTAAGGTPAIGDNGAGFSRRCIVKSMATVTPRLPVAVCAVAAEAKRLLISKLATMTFW